MPPRRRRWGRWLALCACAVVLGVVLLRGLHPFLAVSSPVAARTLVVEGWLPDYALESVVDEFRRGGYERVFTTGGPLVRGSLLAQYRSYAESAAATLLALGLSTNQVTAVPTQERYRNRTFSAAVALRVYCNERGVKLSSLNLVSLGAHARRSWFSFRRAFGATAEVGVIALENREYDPGRWWASSEGFKTTLGEPIGLLYAWVFADYGN